MFETIPGSDGWTSMEPVPKGWSRDVKYRVETEGGDSLLLRISDIGDYSRKKMEYDALRRLDGLSILMTRPVAFGTLNDGSSVFTMTTWIEGTDAESVLPELAIKEQYDLGWEAGRVLRRIHQIPAPPGQPDWAERFNRKIDRNIRNYEGCGIEVPGADLAIRHINSLRHLLEGRPQVFQHGDYHCGNMIVNDDGQVGIIDFNRLDYGDPWEEFNRVVWCAAVSGAFASGRINGYFAHDDAADRSACGSGLGAKDCSRRVAEISSERDLAGLVEGCFDVHAALSGDSRCTAGDHSDAHVPHDFFRLMSLYIASNMLSSVPWAIPFGQGEVDVMLKQAESVLDWYDGFSSLVPRWYVSSVRGHRFKGGSNRP